MTPRSFLSRRQFLAAFGVAAAGSATAAVDASTWARERVRISRYEVEVPGLPDALVGMTIAHLTDIHFYNGMDPGARRAMALVSELKPDLTVLTGDYVESVGQLVQLAPFLRACQGKEGTVLTMGNWEHQVGILPRQIREVAESSGAVFLLNETFVLRRGSASLAVVGLDDPRAGLPMPSRALPDVPSGAATIWAFHAPGYADLLAAERYPRPHLMLSGHTHGGQIRIPFLPPVTPLASGRFVAGWYRTDFAPLYVSRGIGTSVIRARFRCPPEIPFFSLRRA